MNRFSAVIVSLLFVLPLSAAAETPKILVPAGTAIAVHIVGELSSGNAKEGDPIQIAVADNVIVNGMIVIAKGAGGAAEISHVDSAGGNGHSGSLGLKFDYVYSVDGGKIALVDSEQRKTEDDRTGAKSTANIVGVATLGLGGLFAHNFAHGHQKTIDDKTIFTAFIADTIHVAASEAAPQDRYDH